MDKLAKILGKPKPTPATGVEPMEDEDLGSFIPEAEATEVEAAEDTDPVAVLDSIEQQIAKLRGLFA